LSIEKVRNSIRKIYFQLPIEAFIWMAGLVILATLHPEEDQHISICFFNSMGFKFCPGCGLGRSLAFLMHGEIARSLQLHPLGPFALLVLLYRICQLMNRFIREKIINKPYHGKRIETST
jgi:hypothetical protein